MSKTTTDLTTLKINYLSQEAYDAEVSGGTIEEDEIYLTPSTPHIIGQIIAYAGANEPIGWLKCDGRAVSRTIYSALYSVVGTTYGSGDGSTTFNLPNFVDRFPVGAGNLYDLNDKDGSKDAVVVTHQHEPNDWIVVTNKDYANAGDKILAGSSGSFSAKANASKNTDLYVSKAPSNAVSGTDKNMPPYIAVNYLIYVGVSVII